MNLEDLESVEVIDDPTKIEAVLMDADKEFRTESSSNKINGQTTIVLDDEGKVQVNKQVKASVDSAFNFPPPDELQKLAKSRGIEWKDGYQDRVVPYFGSDERVDRHGDIVRQNWDFSEFKTNPVVPFSHDWEMPPIGNSIRWKVIERSDSSYTGPALHLLDLFADNETWAFADTIFRLVKAGFLKTSSVGFYPGVIVDVKSDAEREQLGLGRWGFIYDKNILIEHSPTTVPANVGAVSLLRSMKSEGKLKAYDSLALREMERREIKRGAGDLNYWLEREAKWIATWNMLFPEIEFEVHRNLDEPIILQRKEDNQYNEQLRNIEASIEELRDLISEQPLQEKECNPALFEIITGTTSLINSLGE